jgi:hypothetical protein
MKTKLFLPLFLALSLGAAAYSTSSNSKDSDETTVLICKSSNAYAYHNHKCSGLQRCKSEIVNMRISDAKKQGRVACKLCYK